MARTLLLLSLLLFYQIVQDLACFGGGKKKHPTLHPILIWQMYGKKKGKGETREHWFIPDDRKTQYGEWIQSYMINQTILAKLDKNSTLPKGMTVPETWKGYGAGHTGHDPPPWAIVEEMRGKPDYCFDDPDKGHCNKKIKRWGYNSFIAECAQFEYSGCGGNFNNFKTQTICEETCLHPAQSNCQKCQDYKQYDINDTTYKITS